MRITARQIRQIIREELSRLQETRRDDDEADDMEFYSGEEGGEEGEEGSGYEYLSRMPGTIEWVDDGSIDITWVNGMLRRFKSRLPDSLLPIAARDFEKMLAGKRVDPDIAAEYRNADGTSMVSRQSMEMLVDLLHGRKPKKQNRGA
jgi:hypothetical protein